MSLLLDWFLNKLNAQNNKLTLPYTIPPDKQSNAKMEVCILFVVSNQENSVTQNRAFPGFFKELKMAQVVGTSGAMRLL